MRRNYTRHLSRFIQTGQQYEAFTKSTKSLSALREEKEQRCGEIDIPDEFNARDWLAYLLHIDAELEHGLMVQYLYGAYSIGGDHIPAEYQQKVAKWREIVLGIAKEEMGHFVSVQNVLRVIGAPLNFTRQDFPWDTELYPFPFKLEKFSKESLAKYIYAESPSDWLTITEKDSEETAAIKTEIKVLVEKSVNRNELGDPISCIFKQVLALLNNDELIPDDVFLTQTYPYQAKFDEWGRGYTQGARGNSAQYDPKNSPNVLVAPLLSRTATINAVKAIAEQGESTNPDETELSHFERFLSIYKDWRDLPETFDPSRDVATNPTIPPKNGAAENTCSPSEGQSSDQEIDYIINENSQMWASLFDIRYRMLLNFLTHSFLLEDGLNNTGAFTPRGTIIHATFGEMYNLRSISHVLMKLPLGGDSKKNAGPSFTVPYTLDLPIGEKSRWQLHKDLIAATKTLADKLLLQADANQKTYLYSLIEADGQLDKIAQKIIQGNH